MASGRIGIAWDIHRSSGWGVYGYQIVRHLCFCTGYTPVALERMDFGAGDSLEAAMLRKRTKVPLDVDPEALEPYRATGKRLPFPVLHARGGGLHAPFSSRSHGVLGSTNHALTFFENAHIPAEDVTIYNRFASVTAGSTWNGELLQAAGVTTVGVHLQGVDPSRFHPAPGRTLFKDKFVVFCGGKMEFRKGQDIALAALKIFIDRHPDTVLLAVWGNQWANGMSYRKFHLSPHLEAVPALTEDGKHSLSNWVEAFEIKRRHVYAFGTYPHHDLPSLIRQADVALFPNRCEGGTNLAAMEAMACGIPTIISRNTGHLDIIHEGACLPLEHQAPVPTNDPKFDTAGWGESSVDEIVEHLEFAYQNREAAREIGLRGAGHMHELSWDNQIAGLLSFVESHGLG